MGKGGSKSETSKQAPAPKTKAARRGPPLKQQNVKAVSSGIAQRPRHHAIAVLTAKQNRVTKTMSVAPPLGNLFGDSWAGLNKF